MHLSALHMVHCSKVASSREKCAIQNREELSEVSNSGDCRWVETVKVEKAAGGNSPLGGGAH